jgi:hypothetical protein
MLIFLPLMIGIFMSTTLKKVKRRHGGASLLKSQQAALDRLAEVKARVGLDIRKKFGRKTKEEKEWDDSNDIAFKTWTKDITSFFAQANKGIKNPDDILREATEVLNNARVSTTMGAQPVTAILNTLGAALHEGDDNYVPKSFASTLNEEVFKIDPPEQQRYIIERTHDKCEFLVAKINQAVLDREFITKKSKNKDPREKIFKENLNDLKTKIGVLQIFCSKLRKNVDNYYDVLQAVQNTRKALASVLSMNDVASNYDLDEVFDALDGMLQEDSEFLKAVQGIIKGTDIDPVELPKVEEEVSPDDIKLVLPDDKKEEPKTEEPKPEASKKEEPKPEESKKEEPKPASDQQNKYPQVPPRQPMYPHPMGMYPMPPPGRNPRGMPRGRQGAYAAQPGMMMDPLMAQQIKDQNNIFLAIKNLIKSVIDSFKNTHSRIRIYVLISLVITLFASILSLVYLGSAFVTFANTLLVKNPVNENSLDYRISRMGANILNPMNIFYSLKGFNYVFFLVLPWIQVLTAGFALINLVKKSENGEQPYASSTVIILMIALCIQGALSLIFNYVVFFNAYRVFRLVHKRITNFNIYIWKRMYKGSDKNKFYENLREVQANPFSVRQAAARSLSALPKDIPAEDLARAMFTVTMYFHYHKLGVRNPSIYNAMDQFDPLRLLVPNTFSPADYLFRQGTFIDDVAEQVAANDSTFLSKEIKNNKKLINDAVEIHAEWIAEANNRANSIFPDDSMIPFFQMAIIMLIIQTLPFLILIIVFKKKERREAFFRALNINRTE